MEISEDNLKSVIKSVLLELMAENREVFYEAVKEIIIDVFENEGMKNAMAEVEGEDNESVDIEEVYAILDQE